MASKRVSYKLSLDITKKSVITDKTYNKINMWAMFIALGTQIAMRAAIAVI